MLRLCLRWVLCVSLWCLSVCLKLPVSVCLSTGVSVSQLSFLLLSVSLDVLRFVSAARRVPAPCVAATAAVGDDPQAGLGGLLVFVASLTVPRLMLSVARNRATKAFEIFRPNVIVASSFGAVVLFHMKIPKLPLVGFVLSVSPPVSSLLASVSRPSLVSFRLVLLGSVSVSLSRGVFPVSLS